jgi:hypothetical protein
MVPDRRLKFAFAALALGLGVYSLMGGAGPLLFGCLAFMGGSLLWNKMMPGTLICVPIPLVHNRQVEVPLTARLGECYELDLEFERQGHADSVLQRLLGSGIPDEMWLKLKEGGHLEAKHFVDRGLNELNEQDGVVVPVRWEVLKRDDRATVASGQHDSKAQGGWSDSHINRLIGRLSIPRGQYVFRADIPHPIVELSAINARLRLFFEPTHGESWQNAFSYLLAFLAYFVAAPVAVLSGIVLLVRWLAA